MIRPGNVLSMFWLLGGGQGLLRRYAFRDSLGDFFQMLADHAGPCSVDVLAYGRCWAGMLLEMVWNVFPKRRRQAMLCRCFGFWAVVGRGCSAGMLLGMIRQFFVRCQPCPQSAKVSFF